MSTQQQMSAERLQAWRAFLRAHCTITRELDTELRAEHGLTINDYDVLVQLREAPNGIRMSELADYVVLTRSGITRLIDGLARDGLVERRSCEADARVSYAVMTERGREIMQTARDTHMRGIERVFQAHFSDAEAATLADLLSRLPGGSEPCRTPGNASGC